MKKCKLKTTVKIIETFKKKGLKFRTTKFGSEEIIFCGFSVPGGPDLVMQFTVADDENSVCVRVFDMFTKTTPENRRDILTTCNVVNDMVKYVKFCMGRKGFIKAEYDFSPKAVGKKIGKEAFRVYDCMVRIICDTYPLFEITANHGLVDEDGLTPKPWLWKYFELITKAISGEEE